MPLDVPRANLWFICLCSSTSCKEPNDESVAVNFPIAGFALHEVDPQALETGPSSAAAAVRSYPLPGFGPLFLLVLALKVTESSAVSSAQQRSRLDVWAFALS